MEEEEDEKEGRGMECGKREGKITDGEIRSDYCCLLPTGQQRMAGQEKGEGKKKERKKGREKEGTSKEERVLGTAEENRLQAC